MNQTLRQLRDEYVQLRNDVQSKWKAIPPAYVDKYTHEYNLLIDKINILITLTKDLISKSGGK